MYIIGIIYMLMLQLYLLLYVTFNDYIIYRSSSAYIYLYRYIIWEYRSQGRGVDVAEKTVRSI